MPFLVRHRHRRCRINHSPKRPPGSRFGPHLLRVDLMATASGSYQILEKSRRNGQNFMHFRRASSVSENGGNGLDRNENNDERLLTIFDRVGEVRPPLKLSQRMDPSPSCPPPRSLSSSPSSPTMRSRTQKTSFNPTAVRSSVSISHVCYLGLLILALQERLRKSASATTSPSPRGKKHAKSLASRISDNITIDLTLSPSSSPKSHPKGGRSSRLSSGTSESGSEDDVEEILLGTSTRRASGTLNDPIVLGDELDDGYGPSTPPKRRSTRHQPLSARIEAPSLIFSHRTRGGGSKSAPSTSTVPLAKRVAPRRVRKRKGGDDGASVQETISSVRCSV